MLQLDFGSAPHIVLYHFSLGSLYDFLLTSDGIISATIILSKMGMDNFQFSDATHKNGFLIKTLSYNMY